MKGNVELLKKFSPRESLDHFFDSRMKDFLKIVDLPPAEKVLLGQAHWRSLVIELFDEKPIAAARSSICDRGS